MFLKSNQRVYLSVFCNRKISSYRPYRQIQLILSKLFILELTKIKNLFIILKKRVTRRVKLKTNPYIDKFN